MDRGAVLFHVVCHVDNEVIAPVGDDGWTGDRTVERHACSLVSVGGAWSLFDREPVFAGEVRVGGHVVVVGCGGKLPPAVTRGGRVLAGRLTGVKRRMGGRNREGTSAAGEDRGEEEENRGLHVVGREVRDLVEVWLCCLRRSTMR